MTKMECEISDNTCVLEMYMNCGDLKKPISAVGQARRRSLILASEQRGDVLHTDVKLKEGCIQKPDLYVHKDCASTYTSKHHIKRYLALQERQPPEEGPVPKRSRRARVTCSISNMRHMWRGMLR